MSSTTPGPFFKLLHQEKSYGPKPDGTMGHTWTVHYESPSGTKSYVEIPAHEYSAENVAKAIQAESAEIEKVHDMGKP